MDKHHILIVYRRASSPNVRSLSEASKVNSMDVNPIDPKHLSQNSLKIYPRFRAHIQIQSLIGLLYAVNTFCMVLFLKNVGKSGKNVLFPRYSLIGKIPHRQLWPDWGLKGKNNDLWMSPCLKSGLKILIKLLHLLSRYAWELLQPSKYLLNYFIPG